MQGNTGEKTGMSTNPKKQEKPRLNVGVGLADEVNTETAARNAVREAMDKAGLTRAAWAVCFFSGPHISLADVVRRVVMEESGCLSLAGCSAPGVIGAGKEVQGRSGLAVMVGSSSALETRSGILGSDGMGLHNFREPPSRKEANMVAIAMPDSFRIDNEILAAQMTEMLDNVPVYGAGASDDGNLGISLQLGMEGVHSGSISMMGFYGDLETHVGITQSCQPVGDPHFITKAKDFVLMELDGKSALRAFMDQGKALGMESLQDAANELMFGIPLDAESPSFRAESCLVRPLAGFDQETKGLLVPHPLREQHTMGFMHRNPEKAALDVRRMAADLAREGIRPDFGFYFNCAGRGEALYGREQEDIRVIHQFLGDFPLIGMFGGYELATAHGAKHIYTYTGVLVLFTVG